MKSDTLFYQVFQILPGTLFELVGKSAETARRYAFDSVEVKGHAFRVDGVFKPLVDSPEETIFFLENQMQREEGFHSRLFSEIFLYIKLKQPLARWHTVVLFPTRAEDPGLSAHFAELSGRLSVFYLDDLEQMPKSSIGLEILKLIMESTEKAREHGRAILQKLREEPGGSEENQKLKDLVGKVLLAKFPEMTEEEFEAMYQLEDYKKSVIYQKALHEGELKGIREGELKGKREGKRAGELKGKLQAVPVLLELGASVEKIAQDLDLDVKVVRRAARKRANSAK